MKRLIITAMLLLAVGCKDEPVTTDELPPIDYKIPCNCSEEPSPYEVEYEFIDHEGETRTGTYQVAWDAYRRAHAPHPQAVTLIKAYFGNRVEHYYVHKWHRNVSQWDRELQAATLIDGTGVEFRAENIEVRTVPIEVLPLDSAASIEVRKAKAYRLSWAECPFHQQFSGDE